MNRFLHAVKRNAIAGLMMVFVLGISQSGLSQTNPATFDLSTGSFSFTTQTATNTSYPTNMQGWTTGTNNIAVLPTAAPGADQALVASGTASTSGLSNLGASGFNFLSTGSSPNQQVGEICVALNSTGRTNILVSWLAADQTTGSTRQMNMTLQYRTATTGAFTTVASSTYTTSNTAQAASQTFTNVALPAACENQSVLQIRWVTYESAAQSGGRDAIRLDDITVSSSAGANTITSNAVTGNWSAGGSWVGGVAPTSADNAVIVSGAVITMDVTTGGINTRNSGTTTTVNTGGTFATSVQYINNGTTTINGAFQLNAGGFTNSGNNFVYGASGTLIFNNTGSSYGVNNTDQYWPTSSGPVNVSVLPGGMTLNSGANRTVTGTFQTAAAVTLTSATLTLNGTVKINTGGSFANSPTYGSASTLVYNTGAAFGRSNEWTTATSGAGYPANVQISNPGTVTTLNMGSTSAQCSGSITVDASTILNTTSGGLTVLGSVTTNGTTNTGGALNVTGTVTTNGTISLGGDVTLSGTSASDWVVGASATQTNNSKAVFFTGASGAQNITKTGGGVVFFDYLVINKAAGTVAISASPATDVTINTTAGDVLQLLNAGALDLNGRTLTLNNGGGSIAANAANRSITSGATGATLAITGAKSFSGAGTLVINTNVTTVLSAGFDFGVSKVTVNGTLQLSSGGFASNGSAPTYASGSTLLFNTGGNYDMHNGSADVAGWFRNVASTGSAQAGVPWNVTISNNTSVRYNTANTDNFPRYINGNLIINSGSTFTLGGLSGTAGDFFLRGNWTNSGTFNPNVRLVTFNGASAQTLTGSTTFDYLTLSNSTGLTLQTSSPVTVNQTLSLTSGKINLGANNLTIAATGSISSSSTNYIVTNSSGLLIRKTVGNTATLFPIGFTTTNYTPVSITNTSGTSDLSVSVKQSITNAVSDATKIVTLEWGVTSSAATTATIATTWVAATPINQAASFTNTGAGELGNYTTAYTTYPVTLNTTTTTATGVAMQSGTNLIVVGNTGAVYTPPPANDVCSGAQVIPATGPFPYLTTVVNNTNASTTGDPTPTCQATFGHSVWYTISPTVSGTYIFSTCSAETSTTIADDVMSLYSGSCGTLTAITCNDDGGSSCAGTLASISATLTAGTTYYIMVSGYSTNVGNIQIKITAPLSAPVATLATPIVSTGFNANWGTVPLASGGYLLDVSTSATFGTSTPTTLTEGFNNGTTAPSGWSITSGISTYTSAGNFGASSPSLQFNLSAQSVVTATLTGAATQLSFWIKGNGTNAASALLVEGYNGSSWVTIENITNSLPTSGTTKTYNSSSTPALASNFTQFRFTYTKSNGNLAFDDVSINYNVVAGSFVTGYNAKPVSGQATVTSAVTGLTTGTYYYRLRSTDGTNSSSNSNTITVTINDPATADYRTKATGNFSNINTWEYNSGNSGGNVYANVAVVPASTNNVEILHAVTLDQAFTLGSGKTLALTTGNLSIGSNTLTLNGTVTRTSGALNGTSSSILSLGGSSAQSLAFATGASLASLNVAKTGGTSTLTSVGDTLRIYTGIDFTGNSSGVLALNGQEIKLKSNATGTAYIGQSSTTSLTGATAITVERYIPANSNRAWRLLAVPTTGSQTINSAWQNSQASGVAGTAGLGTWITSNAVGATGLGYDAQTPGNSLLTYNQTSNLWVGVTSNTTTTQLAPSGTDGYMLYVRGDRTSTNGNTTITPTTLFSRGGIKQNNQSAITVPAETNIATGNYVMIGNPFASTINLPSLTLGGFANQSLLNFFVWDPQMGTIGGFVTLQKSGANYVAQTVGGVTFPQNSTVNTIQSGQAFFIQSQSVSGSVAVPEAAKVTTSSLVFRPGIAAAAAKRYLITALYAGQDNTARIMDGTTQYFDPSFSNLVDDADARKLGNFTENLGISNGVATLSVEKRGAIAPADTIFFSISNMKIQGYQLRFIAAKLTQPGVRAFLEDSYLHTSTPVALNDTTTVNFTVDANAGSYATNRFRLVFKTRPVAIADNNTGTDGLSAVSNGTAKSISVYPNPVTGGIVNISFKNEPAGNYRVMLYTMKGQPLFTKTMSHAGGNAAQSLLIGKGIANGSYKLAVIHPDNTRTEQTIIVTK